MTDPLADPQTAPPSPTERRLRRRSEGTIGGVAAGLAEYLGVDPILFRAAFLFLSIFLGAGVLFYLAAWLLVPADDDDDPRPLAVVSNPPALVGGFALAVGGLALLADGSTWRAEVIIPGALIVLGLWFLNRRDLAGFGAAVAPNQPPPPFPGSQPPPPPPPPPAPPPSASASAAASGSSAAATTGNPLTTPVNPGVDPNDLFDTPTADLVDADAGRDGDAGTDADRDTDAGPEAGTGAGTEADTDPEVGAGRPGPPGPRPPEPGTTWISSPGGGPTGPHWARPRLESDQPKPPPGPPVTSITLATAAVVAGALLVIRNLGHVHIGATVILGSLAAVFGLGLVASSVLGRARPLIPLGLMTMALLSVAPLIDNAVGGGVGSRNVVATGAVGDLQPTYEIGFGELDVDLTSIDLSVDRQVSIEVGGGNAEVRVPAQATVEVEATNRAGYLSIFRTDDEGVWNEVRLVSPGIRFDPDEPDGPPGVLTLIIDVTFGYAEVRRG